MYTVMIVDDEEPVLESFSYMLKQGIEGFSLCATARSGYEALQLCSKFHPDVIFMDIGMPGIDGLETISLLQKDFPETVYILSTAYERFDIAKQAIPLGVFSYLVKPILKKTFRETLEKVKEFLDERKEHSQDYLELMQMAKQSMVREERGFISQLPWKIIDEEEWTKKRERFSLKSDYGILIFIPNHSLGETQKALSYDTIVEKLSYHIRCLWGVSQGMLVLLVCEDFSLSQLDTLIERTLLSSKPPLWKRTSYIHYSEFSQNGRSLIQEIENDLERQHPSRKEMRMITELRKSLVTQSPAGQPAQLFNDVLDRYLGCYDLVLAKGKLIYCFALLCEECRKHLSELDTTTCFDPVEEIMPLQEPILVKQWAQQRFDDLLTHLFAQRDDQLPLPLKKAIRYIDEHYRHQLQLTMVAEACMISPAYLSRLFSEHLYTSFVEYLTRLRITKAEELLKEGVLSVKQVSYEVGFHDPNYFSKIFRKYVGMAPIQYIQGKE